MVDPFVEAQNRLKPMSHSVVRYSVWNAAEPRSSLLVHTCGHEVTGLKTYRGPKRKHSSARVPYQATMCQKRPLSRGYRRSQFSPRWMDCKATHQGNRLLSDTGTAPAN